MPKVHTDILCIDRQQLTQRLRAHKTTLENNMRRYYSDISAPISTSSLIGELHSEFPQNCAGMFHGRIWQSSIMHLALFNEEFFLPLF